MLSVQSSTDPTFQTILPRMIEYSENRINSDLDLISTVTTANAICQANNRNLTMPECIYIVENVNIITPTATNPDFGTRNPLERMSVAMMNYTWPTAASISTSTSTAGSVPDYFAVLNADTILLAPAPDANYKAEVVGIFIPDPLSATNTETYISQFLPELFIAASMVFGAGYQRDFGATSDDPQRAQSWENQYQLLLKSDMVQEFRKKSQSSQWSPYSPTPLAPRQ